MKRLFRILLNVLTVLSLLLFLATVAQPPRRRRIAATLSNGLRIPFHFVPFEEIPTPSLARLRVK